jgi:hypothetical protein
MSMSGLVISFVQYEQFCGTKIFRICAMISRVGRISRTGDRRLWIAFDKSRLRRLCAARGDHEQDESFGCYRGTSDAGRLAGRNGPAISDTGFGPSINHTRVTMLRAAIRGVTIRV